MQQMHVVSGGRLCIKTMCSHFTYLNTTLWRSKSNTTYEMINDYNLSTRYRRREETKNILDFIHGGFEPSLHGAWDSSLQMLVRK